MRELTYTSNLDDTIAAISTPLGQAGLGIVRISGKQSFSIADKFFHGKIKPSAAQNHTVHYGKITDPRSNETVDEVLLPRKSSRSAPPSRDASGGTATAPPARTAASKPQASVISTGLPHAPASSATSDIASCRDGMTTRSAARYAATLSRPPIHPTNLTRSLTPA